MKEFQSWLPFQSTTGANRRSAMEPPSHGHGVSNHRRISGTIINQTRILSPRNQAVYFESSAAPAAAPTASHHEPRPVSINLARKNRTKALATSNDASGVTIRVPTATINVRLKNKAAVAESLALLKRIWAERQTAQVAGTTSNAEMIRTPNSVSPAMSVPSRIKMATIGG